MQFPEMVHIRQVFDAPEEVDIEAAVDRELAAVRAGELVKPGTRIAITAGSRGIANIDRILRRTAAVIKQLGGQPFFFPAMGSHGGGTAAGQLEILKDIGISEVSVGAPILASMDVVNIGTSSHGFPVLVDRYAAEADGIVVINRIKPHTEFEGPLESGLAKMLAIGMGKHKGCFQVHKQTVNFGYRAVIPEIGKIIREQLPVLFGIGIVENIYDRTAHIKALPVDQFESGEKRLLEKAKALMARLPFDTIDVLIVDEMGKNISGTGMDTNVIGRIMFVGESEPESPRITRIVVLGLTAASHGNAIGVGLADYTTAKLAAGIDHRVTATNAIAAMTPEKGRLPIALATEKEAIAAALDTIGAIPAGDARVVHIKNTLEIAELDVSRSLLEEVRVLSSLEIGGPVGPLAFDAHGNLERKINIGKSKDGQT